MFYLPYQCSKADKNYKKGQINLEINGNVYSFNPRPHADEFLRELKIRGKICLCTAASRRYAKRVLDALGLRDYFDEIFSRESYGVGLPCFEKFIFIDNDEAMARQKIGYIKGIGTLVKFSKLIIVPTYWEGDDDSLMQILEKIREELHE